jgi:hypothetical protein
MRLGMEARSVNDLKFSLAKFVLCNTAGNILLPLLLHERQQSGTLLFNYEHDS